MDVERVELAKDIHHRFSEPSVEGRVVRKTCCDDPRPAPLVVDRRLPHLSSGLPTAADIDEKESPRTRIVDTLAVLRVRVLRLTGTGGIIQPGIQTGRRAEPSVRADDMDALVPATSMAQHMHNEQVARPGRVDPSLDRLGYLAGSALPLLVQPATFVAVSRQRRDKSHAKISGERQRP